MNDDQITALAREYAEWVTDVPKAEELPNCLLNEANNLIAKNAERVLTWLSHRYCLVEKEQYEASVWISPDKSLPEFNERVLICEKVANKHKIFIGRRIRLSNGTWGWSQSANENVIAWRHIPQFTHEIAGEEK